ncbi:hypothetical protein SVAN01_00087 [Stagonosporopsis vannaccii]|nr:hypothetical protein SVAN01_00087 [Stagonosporopsis vannaccii]
MRSSIGERGCVHRNHPQRAFGNHQRLKECYKRRPRVHRSALENYRVPRWRYLKTLRGAQTNQRLGPEVFFNGQNDVLYIRATQNSPQRNHDIRACTPVLRKCGARISLGVVVTSQSTDNFSSFETWKHTTPPPVVGDQAFSTLRVRERSADVRRRLLELTITASSSTSQTYAPCNCPPQDRVHDGAQREGTPQTQVASTEKDSTVS